MTETRFTAEWVQLIRVEWRQKPLTDKDIETYRINYDIPGWAASDYRNSLPFGACLAIERLCCEVERLREINATISDSNAARDLVITALEDEVDRLREENSRMLEAIKLNLRHHEHGCSYLGEFVDYEEIYR